MPDVTASPGTANGAALCSVTAVVLAAGLSSRLARDKSKLLCLWNGRPIILHTVENIVASPVTRVIVVVGHQGEELMRALAGQEVEFAMNDNPADGMSGSLIAGLRKVSEGEHPDGVMICLGDMPLIKPYHIADLIQRFSETRELCIWRPVYEDTPGHPVIFGTGLLNDLSGVEGDKGAKDIIGRHRHLLHYLPVEDESVVFDVDTLCSLEQLRRTDSLT
jgi:molybdenum cofactor cytidylyltransferase